MRMEHTCGVGVVCLARCVFVVRQPGKAVAVWLYTCVLMLMSVGYFCDGGGAGGC